VQRSTCLRMRKLAGQSACKVFLAQFSFGQLYPLCKWGVGVSYWRFWQLTQRVDASDRARARSSIAVRRPGSQRTTPRTSSPVIAGTYIPGDSLQTEEPSCG
jgi:hypothetical protein